MKIKTKKSFNNVVKNLALEIFDKELDEFNTTASVGGEYMTPMAFNGKKKKKLKKINNKLGFKSLEEEIDSKDLETIKKLIKGVLNNMFRDIWLKRNAWNRL